MFDGVVKLMIKENNSAKHDDDVYLESLNPPNKNLNV